MSLTYAKYLQLDRLLSSQQPLSAGPEHDELLFITIHQVYELWFMQILHEIDYLQELLLQSAHNRSLHTLDRVRAILKVLVAQLDVLETMTPQEFLSFRHRLDSASGFESFQFRELEFLLGMKRRSVINHFADSPAAQERLERRYEQPALWDNFLRYLVAEGYEIPAGLLARDVTQPTEPSVEVQKVLVEIYHHNARLTQLCERLVDLDEGLQEWRYRHVKMVQRTIGTKKGTGGSAGADYLLKTLFKPVFPDLWAIRTEL